jgi:MYXO-CTERM domain-containing protein
VKIPWTGSEFAYADAIARAVDEAPGGRGFVTEYAGPSTAVGTDAVWSATWDASVFETAEPTEVVDLLEAQGLATCSPKLGPCLVPYPLVVAMLRKYLPAPPDANENDFYSCLSCYADQTDFADWDGPAFAAELGERVIDPGLHAVDLLQGWPYLTRLFTRVSAEEMTVDPIFHANPDLPEVPLPSAASEMCLECDQDAVATLPDGRMVYMPGSGWPSFVEMPWAERIENIPPRGAPMVELDQRAMIDALLAAWNGAQECGVGSTGSDDNDVDGYDEDDAEGGGASATAASDGGTAGDDGGTTSGGSPTQDDGAVGRGCGCGSTTAPLPAWLLVLLGAVLARRR